jgi:predicted DCC family thiol-disulfide oxidoreductase YuxK
MDSDRLIVFYDGKCPFCVGWVKFLMDRDGNDRFRFASLQSDWAARFFQEQNLKHPGMESVVTWDGSFLETRSAAAITLAGRLPGIWSVGRHMDIFPTRLRNNIYDWVAQNRYKWFGTYDQCWVPKPEDRRKFLDLEGGGVQHADHGDGPGDNQDSDKRKRDI